jgi:hypothetical protein
MSHSAEGIIQIFNADNDTLYVELIGGNAFWLIPDTYQLSDVKFLSHLTEDGSCYYENLANSETSWTLPSVMSASARSNAAAFQKMSREETEMSLIDAFPEDESAELVARIDAFFDPDADKREQEEQEQEQEEQEEEEDVTPPPARRSTLGNMDEHSSDEEDAVNALASINNTKPARAAVEMEDPEDSDEVEEMYQQIQSVFEKTSRPASVARMPLKTIAALNATTIKVTVFCSSLVPSSVRVLMVYP